MEAIGRSAHWMESTGRDDEPMFVVSSARSDDELVISVGGELDMSSRQQFVECIADDQTSVVVDMAGLTFMDCGGYGALAAARNLLTNAGRFLTIRNQHGEPARFLGLIESVDLIVI